MITIERLKRKCRECNRIKLIHDFPTMVKHNKADNPIWRRHCKPCDKILSKQRKEIVKKYGKNPPNKKYRCPTCDRNERTLRKETSANSIWSIDHDHKTGEFRGWMCHQCNKALGSFNDSVEILERAIDHLNGKTMEELSYLFKQ